MLKHVSPLLSLFVAVSILNASPPAWWSDPQTQILETPGDPGPVAENYAPLNIGQLKHVASQAHAHLEVYLPGGVGFMLGDLWPDIPVAENYAPVNVGQLKAIAKPYYDRLIEAGYDTRGHLIARGYPSNWGYDYPWPDDGSVPIADNYSPANIGQLKLVFSFDLSTDTSGDGVPDWYKLFVELDPNDSQDVHQIGPNGITYYQDYRIGLGLRGHWPLTESAGTLASDSSAFHNDGDLSASGVEWLSDAPGVTLDGSGVITVGNPLNDSLDLGDESITLSIWFRTTDTGWKSFFSKGPYGYSAGYSIGLVGNSGRVFATLGGSSEKLHMRTVNEFNDGEWHHAVAVFDRDQEKAWMYVDGIRETITNVHDGTVINGDTLDFAGVTTPTASSNRNFYIGAMANSSNNPVYRLDGDIGQVRIYNRSLDENEIDSLYVPPDLDSNGDGIPDWWKVHHFGTLDVNPYDDPDGDGHPNIYEFLFGFDPNVPSPPPTSDLYFYDFSGDGIASGWKLENGLDPLEDYTGLSPDGSSLTYLELWQLSLEDGNDPVNANIAGLIVYTP